MDINNPMIPKKAVHVKWAGKTIALGTFPIAEADEKCARAKALTRAWRSTIRPKPSREWVMDELERMGIRTVSGRQLKEEEEVSEKVSSPQGSSNNNVSSHSNISGMPNHRGSITSTLMNPMDMSRIGTEYDHNRMMAVRNSSMGGFSNGSYAMGNMSSLGMGNMATMPSNSMGGGMNMSIPLLKPDDTSVPPHRPLVGGGAAAAYEAAREQHYRDLAERKRVNNNIGGDFNAGRNLNPMNNMMVNDPQASLGGAIAGYGGLSASASQHYEMLKLHHMNLLNEIQETTLMMNIYQQQQLQHQKQMNEHQMQNQMRMGVQNMNGSVAIASNSSRVEDDHDDDDDDDDDSDRTGEEEAEPKSDSKEEKLRKLKAEIEERQRMLVELDEAERFPNKRTKVEDDISRKE